METFNFRCCLTGGPPRHHGVIMKHHNLVETNHYHIALNRFDVTEALEELEYEIVRELEKQTIYSTSWFDWGDVNVAAAIGNCSSNATEGEEILGLPNFSIDFIYNAADLIDCSDVVITSSQFPVEKLVMQTLQSNLRGEVQRHSAAVHYEIISGEIPYLSVAGYTIKNQSKLEAKELEFSMNSRYDKIVETDVVEFQKEIYRKTKEQIFVKDLNFVCRFVNSEEHSFSGYGCNKTGDIFSTTRCKCNHTTVFAVLLSIKTVAVPYGVKLCSYTTEAVSVLLLLATVSILLYFRVEIKSDRTFIQINMSFSLLLFHLVNISHDMVVNDATACEAATVATHYLVLTTGCWMLADGVFLLIKTSDNVISFSTINEKKKNAIAFILCMLVPAVIVGAAATVGFFQGEYMSPCFLYTSTKEYKEKVQYEGQKSNVSVRKYDICWLKPNSPIFLATVIAPVATILLANLIITVKVTISIIQLKNRSRKMQNSREGESQYDNLVSATKALIILLPVLGLPWALGFLTGIESHQSSLIFMYLNVIINGLQGVVVFVLFCGMNPALQGKVNRKRNHIGATPKSTSEPTVDRTKGTDLD
uniref:putative adhesion G protein-coupled receptor E4P n=1 Tax=Ciona intestinalis TaxID=7719 RepID=UPI000EF504E5|nr:putative adhesion G protein-coupled receptor E4P [Ciona intestinalis]|eukprot:XP_018669927.2 putative adhesion G protein-coupled receptor E4P [Ciona intestinalis]